MDVLRLLDEGCELISIAAATSLPLFLTVLALTWLARRWIAPWMRHALWTLVLVRLVLPISVASPISLQQVWMFEGSLQRTQGPADLGVATSVAVDATALAAVQATAAWQASPNQNTAPATRWTMTDWFELLLAQIPAVMVLGTGGLLIWTGITSWRLRQQIGHGRAVTDPGWHELLETGRQSLGVRTAVELRIVPSWTCPATMGWWQPRILLPENASTLSQSELRHVIWHELVHIRRGDAAGSLLLTVARCAQWWNPVFWVTQHCWLLERELACDAEVIQHLGDEPAGDYGRTLLMFVERLNGLAPSPLMTQAPGLVMLLGRKSALRHRLEALADLPRERSRWLRGFGWCCLLTVAVAGLTDAATSQPTRKPAGPIAVPAGAIWRVSPTIEADDGPVVTVSYAIKDLLARVRRDMPGLSEEMLRRIVQQDIGSCLQSPWKVPRQNEADVPNASEADALPCQITGDALVVRATSRQHAHIADLIARWTARGQRQIVLEMRLIDTDQDLSQFVDGDRGEVLTTGPTVAQPPHSTSHTGRLEASAGYQRLQSVPAYVQILNGDAVNELVTQAQSDRRTNILCTPKVTVFDGQSAAVMSGTERPFVTGLKSTGPNRVESEITFQTEGIHLEFLPQLSDDGRSTQLSLSFRQTEVVDVEVLKVQSGERELAVQVPHMSEALVHASATLTDGQALLVAPLRRNQRGQLTFCLVTARQITPIEDDRPISTLENASLPK